jgi:hypothetical protein
VRIYTLAEAQALLPQVIPVVRQVRDAYIALRALRAQVAADQRRAWADGSGMADPWAEGEGGGEDRMERLNAELRAGAAALERWGIELKDPERGLIDFYHERDGEIVYLCYLLGEPEIRYWHGLRAGFAGRQPL